MTGLVFASMGVNLIAGGMLLIYLHRQLEGLPWKDWILPIFSLTGASTIAGLTAWVTSWGIEIIWKAEGLIFDLVQLSVSGIIGLIVFSLILMILRINEVDLLLAKLRK